MNGSTANEFKSPFDPAQANNGSDVIANWQNLDYFTVGSPGKQASPAVLDLNGVRTSLTFLWGSIDSYNAVKFYLGGVEQAVVDGNAAFDAGGLPAASGAAFVKVSDLSFDRIEFYSNHPGGGADTAAFEFSNVVATVPLPAGGLLLLGALGGLAVLRRRTAA